MTLAWLSLAIAPQISFPGGEPAFLMLTRWIHFVAGITWIGLLYFFNLVNAPFLEELDAAQRAVVIPRLVPKAMWWFRWSSFVTVLAGIAYWNHIVVVDARNAVAAGEAASAGSVIGSFFVIWTLAFVVEMGLLMSPLEGLRQGAVFGTIMAIVLLATAYCFLAVNRQGWESNRTLAIGIGGGLGWFMMLNVWGLVWRMQKKIIRWTAESASKRTTMPAEAALAARRSFLASRLAFWTSFPMLFFMGAASHYIMFAGR
jgi:uncharacterized membrane protein